MIPSNPNDANEEQKRVNSAVQARIEAMFASVEAESGTPGECAAAILPVMTQIITHVERPREVHFCSSRHRRIQVRGSRGGSAIYSRNARACIFTYANPIVHLYTSSLEKSRESA